MEIIMIIIVTHCSRPHCGTEDNAARRNLNRESCWWTPPGRRKTPRPLRKRSQRGRIHWPRVDGWYIQLCVPPAPTLLITLSNAWTRNCLSHWKEDRDLWDGSIVLATLLTKWARLRTAPADCPATQRPQRVVFAGPQRVENILCFVCGSGLGSPERC